VTVPLQEMSDEIICIENKYENQFYDRLVFLMRDVVHEIGNPLTSMITTLQVLDEGMETCDVNKKRHYVRRVLNEVERLCQYVKKLRVFSVPDKHMEKESVHLASVIEKAVNKMKTITDNPGLSISQQVAPSIWVLVDENAFYQILLNLFLNTGGEKATARKIRIKANKIYKGFVKLVYKDGGQNIPREMVDKLFMPSYCQAEEHNIDIALSLKLIARMGGKMHVEVPRDGKGINFVLYIPAGGSIS
jgi:signal transduction histidine kinase